MAYDSRGGPPVAGERVWAIARMMKSGERLHKRRATTRPDLAYNAPRADTEDLCGRVA